MKLTGAFFFDVECGGLSAAAVDAMRKLLCYG